jgi:hypothetical protein
VERTTVGEELKALNSRFAMIYFGDVYVNHITGLTGFSKAVAFTKLSSNKDYIAVANVVNGEVDLSTDGTGTFTSGTYPVLFF